METTMMLGEALDVGDRVKVWWATRPLAIEAFRAYCGPLGELQAGRVATFIDGRTMTMPVGTFYEVAR